MPPETLQTVRRGSTGADVEALCAATGFSRFPVVGDDGELLGYLHIKDVLETDEARRAAAGRGQVDPARSRRSRDDDLLHDTLEKLQRRGAHMARVVDADGRHARRGHPGGRDRGAGGRDPRQRPPRSRPTPRRRRVVGTAVGRTARVVRRLGCVDGPTESGSERRCRRQWRTRPHATSRVWTVPNALSCCGCSASRCSCGWCSAPRPTAGRWACSMLSGVTDYLDGYLARRLNQTSRLGQILDPVADRLYILAVVIGLALRDIVPWWFAVILPLRDLLLWGLVPILRTRGYSALPGALPRQGRDLQPALRLPAAAARRRRPAPRRRWPRCSAGRSPIWGIGLYWWAGVLYA